ncbi:MAG: protein kinase [Chloroflexota bacterium]
MIGKQLGHYTIVSQLGRGGMASVFLANQEGLGRQVALKLLQPSLAADEVVVQRFQQEARIAANLHHAHIVTIYDIGDIEGVFFIAMRYIEGENLGQLLRREGPLSPERALAMVEQIADALDFAHSRNILHRDIKPANVMVEKGDVLTLTDFGIARAGEQSHLTAVNMVIGTPEYMSPEQARGSAIDKRADLYSLAVLLYETLGGRTPFTSASTPSLLYMHVHEAPRPLSELRPDLPPALSDVLARALAKDPNERYQSGRELVAAARAALSQTPPLYPGMPGVGGTAPTVPGPGQGYGGRPPEGTLPPGMGQTPQPAPLPPRPTPMPGWATPAPGTPVPGPGAPLPQGWGTPPPGASYPGTPIPTAPTGGVTPPPIPGGTNPGAYPPGYAPQFLGQAAPPTGGAKKSSNAWLVFPALAAVALLGLGFVIGTRSGLFGGATATPTPTIVAAKPTAESKPTSAPPTAPLTAPTAAAKPSTAPTAPPSTAVAAATTQPVSKPAEPTPAPKPTAPPPAQPTAAPPPTTATGPRNVPTALPPKPVAPPNPTAPAGPVAPPGAGPDPCPEPNDSYQNACYLGPGADALGYLTSASDVDAYRVEVLDFNVTVHVDLGPIPGNFQAQLADWNGKVFATSQAGGKGQVLEAKAPAPGSYYIYVRGVGGAFNPNRPYQLGRNLIYPTTTVSGSRIPDILWANDFRQGGREAANSETQYATHSVEGGRYTIRMKVSGAGRDKNPSEAYWTGFGPELTDFTMTVDTRIVSGSDAGASIFFRHVDDKNTYQLGLDPKTASAQLWKISGGTITGTGWKKSSNIDASGGVNRIVIRCFQDQILVNVNGDDVITLRDGTFRKGYVGIGALTYSDPATVTFDNILVTTPTER